MFWLLFSSLSLLFSFLGDNNNHLFKSESSYLIFKLLLVITLSYVTGLGGIVSADHSGYVAVYRGFDNISLDYFINHIGFNENLRLDIDILDDGTAHEIGFFIIEFLLNGLGLSEAAYFFTLSLIMNTFIVISIYRYKTPVFSILLFIISNSYYQETLSIRQMMAVSIYVFSLKYYETKEIKKYLFCTLAAISMHISAILLILPLLLYWINMERKKLICSSLFVIWLFSLLIGLGKMSLNFAYYFNLLALYQGYDLYENEQVVNILYNLVVVFMLIFVVMNKKVRIEYLFVLLVMGCVFHNLSVQFSSFYRVALYFDILFCIYMPSFIYKLAKTSKTPILKISPALLFLVNFIFLIKSYIIEGNSLLGKEMYSLSDLF